MAVSLVRLHIQDVVLNGACRLGYFLGHYPDTFALSDNQRTLILQTMIFFIWMSGGAAVFSRLEQDADQPGWDFADAVSHSIYPSCVE
jgi:hypothetical protein